MAAGQGTLPANRRKLGGVKPVHQLLASAVPGDAVTDQAFAWRTVLRWWGHRERDLSPSTCTRHWRDKCAHWRGAGYSRAT